MKRKHPTQGEAYESLLVGIVAWVVVLFGGLAFMSLLGVV
jgi:hypothetical protein